MKGFALVFAVFISQYIFYIQSCSLARIISPQELIANATAIVRAKAVNYTKSSIYGNLSVTESTIRFRIKEVLKKNRRLPRPLLINGYLTQNDNFNQATSPYTFSRSDEYSSLCFAYTYKQNAEYLFILNDKYSPYHTSLAPVNEQLHSPTYADPWYQWVKNQLHTGTTTAPTTTTTAPPAPALPPAAMTSGANRLRIFGFL